jgi:putative glutamine amidotransferase
VEEEVALDEPTSASYQAGGAPVVGIVTRHDVSAMWQAYRLLGQGYDYVHCVSLAGGAPILIPLDLGERAWQSIYARLDGVLFPGGVDVNPVHYGEPPHPRLGQVNDPLDEAELVLARWAMRDRLPTLAICRGIQLVNVAAGGSLYQDLGAQFPGAQPHACSPPEYPRAYRAHTVQVEPGSRLRQALGDEVVPVNSRHHQAVKDLAPGFSVTARAPDGVIEGIELDGAPFVVGVQWHPESLAADDPQMLSLFQVFVEACNRWMSATARA